MKFDVYFVPLNIQLLVLLENTQKLMTDMVQPHSNTSWLQSGEVAVRGMSCWSRSTDS